VFEGLQVSAPFRFPRFFVTSPNPCPYLPGKYERKVFTELNGLHAAELNDALGRIGFRRSQSVAYRPSCADCNSCVSVRVVVDEWKPSGTQKRILKRNRDLEAIPCRPWATDEQYQLLRRYLSARHPGGGMSNMDEMDYADMVEHTPVATQLIEYREPRKGFAPGRLVGACLTDRQADGLSMIYSFYDAESEARPSLGSTIIMDHILRARQLGLPYVYLGYWVKGSRRMAYKAGYQPVERLGPDGWVRFDPDAASEGEKLPLP
jgi:leucyl-tRNA---protein transferase